MNIVVLAGGLLFRTSPFLRWETLRCTQQAKSHNKKVSATLSTPLTPHS